MPQSLRLPNPPRAPAAPGRAGARLGRRVAAARLSPASSLLLFAAVSWFGLWFETPPYARLVGARRFRLSLLLAALFPLVRLRWPERSRALARLDRDAPVAASAGLGAAGRRSPMPTTIPRRGRSGPSTRRVWPGRSSGSPSAPPSPNLAARDPYALRFAADPAGAGRRFRRRLRALRPPCRRLPRDAGAGRDARARAIDAWIDPPAYTGKPPIFLKVDDTAAETVAAPEDSVLVVRADPKAVTVKVSGGLAAVPDKTAGERRFAIHADGSRNALSGRRARPATSKSRSAPRPIRRSVCWIRRRTISPAR